MSINPDQHPGRRQWTSFTALTVLQAQNAFNDNTVRFILLPLGTAVAAAVAASSGVEAGKVLGFYQHILAALLVLPFILFSPLCGWIADRFSRQRVIQVAMALQIVVFSTIALAAANQRLWVATFGFFLLALQSTLLSPAKGGIIKELVGSARLNFANGWVEMTVILGILGGMILGGIWFDSRLKVADEPWGAAQGPLVVLAVATLLPLALSFLIERTPARKPGAHFSPCLLWCHFVDLRHLLGPRERRLAALGVAGFWFIGVVVQLLIVQVAAEKTGGTHGMGTSTSWMAGFASGGIAAGSALVSLIGRRRPVIELAPTGGLLLAASCLFTALAPGGGTLFRLGLVLLGIFSAFFFVPLYAWLQEEAPEAERGRVLASSNILNNLAMVAGTLFQAVLTGVGASPTVQLILLAAIALMAAVLILPVMSKAAWFGTLGRMAKQFYRIQASGGEKVPREGGVLLVSNHVTFVDAFILSVSCPRPLRFLIQEEYYRMPWAHWFLEKFECIPITKTKAKQALQRAADALGRGDMVCIFPEGKLSPKGDIEPFQRGMELILRLQPATVQPVAMHGLWGSFFSWMGGGPFKRFPRRLPYPVRVRFGDPLPPTTTAEEAEASVRRLFAEADDHPHP